MNGKHKNSIRVMEAALLQIANDPDSSPQSQVARKAFRDLTPYLMGDPAATYRRPPTPEERAKANMMPQAGDSVHKRYSKDYEWPVGLAKVFTGKRDARLAQQRLYQKGMAASFTSLPDGTFKIMRVH